MAQNPNKPSIPPEAKKVFQGDRWAIWQWQQRMNDGSTQTFETPERADGVSAIAINKDKKIALLTQIQVPSPDTFFCFPGGEVDPGETPEQACKRELLEEAGCKAGTLEFWKSYYPSSRLAYGFHYFIARDCEVVAPLSPDPGEQITVSWITFDEMFQLALEPKFRHDDFTRDLMGMMLHPEKKEVFRRLLFGV